jgi:histidinol-phosphate aminotransferase
MTDALRAAGITVPPSQGNFVLARFAGEAEATAADAFLKDCGIIVRRVAGYGLPDSLRITVGRTEECEAVCDALTRFMAERKVGAAGEQNRG